MHIRPSSVKRWLRVSITVPLVSWNIMSLCGYERDVQSLGLWAGQLMVSGCPQTVYVWETTNGFEKICNRLIFITGQRVWLRYRTENPCCKWRQTYQRDWWFWCKTCPCLFSKLISRHWNLFIVRTRFWHRIKDVYAYNSSKTDGGNILDVFHNGTKCPLYHMTSTPRRLYMLSIVHRQYISCHNTLCSPFLSGAQLGRCHTTSFGWWSELLQEKWSKSTWQIFCYTRNTIPILSIDSLGSATNGSIIWQ